MRGIGWTELEHGGMSSKTHPQFGVLLSSHISSEGTDIHWLRCRCSLPCFQHLPICLSFILKQQDSENQTVEGTAAQCLHSITRPLRI